ncbi:hypothetical protein [Brevibacillus agri]|uniref:hypothetical protein n=1 Tax=Brevibacillus agri TaxID=51101 RepID=UPI002867FC9B|nr:hypothetical protein [Brevibacillus agri]
MGFGKFGGFSSFASGMDIENIKQTLPLATGEVVKMGDVCEVVKGYARKTKRATNLQGTVFDTINRTMTGVVRAYKIDDTFSLIAYVVPASAIEVLLVEHSADGSIKTPLNTALSISLSTSRQHDMFIDKLANGKYVLITNGLMSAFVLNVDLTTKAISMVASKTAETGTNYGEGSMWIQKVSETSTVVKYAAFYGRDSNSGGLLQTIFTVDLSANVVTSTTPATFDSSAKRGITGCRLSQNRYLIVSSEDLNVYWHVVDYNSVNDTFTVVGGKASISGTNPTGNTNGNWMQILNYAKNKFMILLSTYNNSTGQYYSRAIFAVYNETAKTLALDSGAANDTAAPLTGYSGIDTNYSEPMRLIQVNYNTFVVAGAIATPTGSQKGTRVSVYRLHLKSDGVSPELECVKYFDYTYTNAIAAVPDFVPFDLDKYHLFFGHSVTGATNVKMVNISVRGVSPVGVATHDATSGSITIQLKGVLKGLNLVCGQKYMCNEFGDLSYIEGAHSIGTAISSDSLLIPTIIKAGIVPQD